MSENQTLYIPNDPSTIPGIRHNARLYQEFKAFPIIGIQDEINDGANIAHVIIKRSDKDKPVVQIYPGELADKEGQPLQQTDFRLLEKLYPTRKNQQH